jgi:hypothetical protein
LPGCSSAYSSFSVERFLPFSADRFVAATGHTDEERRRHHDARRDVEGDGVADSSQLVRDNGRHEALSSRAPSSISNAIA